MQFQEKHKFDLFFWKSCGLTHYNFETPKNQQRTKNRIFYVSG